MISSLLCFIPIKTLQNVDIQRTSTSQCGISTEGSDCGLQCEREGSQSGESISVSRESWEKEFGEGFIKESYLAGGGDGNTGMYSQH